MASHRALRIAEAIRETVSAAILFELSDPRVKNVTVLRVEVSGDLRQAVIFVSIMGTDAERRLSLRGLQSATGFVQNKVAKQLQIRFVPALQFKIDDSAKKSVEMSKLIDEALAGDQASRLEASDSADEGADGGDEDEDGLDRDDFGDEEDNDVVDGDVESADRERADLSPDPQASAHSNR